MKLPDNLQFRNTMHGTNGRGGYVYHYTDTLNLGVRMVADKMDKKKPETRVWTFDWLPGRQFDTFAELSAALLPISEEQIEAEKAKYPIIREQGPSKEKFATRCKACSLEGKITTATTWFQLASTPDDASDWFGGLCDEHKPLLEAPLQLLDMLQAEAKLRKDRIAQRRQANQKQGDSDA